MSNLIKVRVFNIKYDTDGQKIQLPDELILDGICDAICVVTGYYASSFNFDFI